MITAKERPILFNAPMVRAILAGDKTQTRRIMKPQPSINGQWHHLPAYGASSEQAFREGAPYFAPRPYGQVGDRLWVRETWGVVSHTWDDDGAMIDWTPDRPTTPIHEMPFGKGYYSGQVIYAADGPNEWAGDDDGGGESRSCWHPSIHMPREASRILLEITGLRVERLQDISEEDALAEGIEKNWTGDPAVGQNGFGSTGWVPECGWINYMEDMDGDPAYTPKDSFRSLWQSINGRDSWQANPFVWVIEFKGIKA